jgi:hypothetical protein
MNLGPNGNINNYTDRGSNRAVVTCEILDRGSNWFCRGVVRVELMGQDGA